MSQDTDDLRRLQSETRTASFGRAASDLLLVPGLTVFVLHAADGTPLCITDSFEEATRDAQGSQLEPVRVH